MSDREFDVLIIGGGPGGLACGQYSARAGRKTAILEEMACGGQTMIIDEIENYPGLGTISGFELSSAFESQAVKFGCEIIYATVEEIVKNEDKSFTVKTSDGDFKALAVVISTGAKHRNLGVPGEEKLRGHGVSYCATCDGPFFKGKKILVCGGGDSAVQEANYLTKLSDNITVCHRRDRFRAQSAVVKALEDTGKATFKMNHNVLSINGDSKVTSVTFLDKTKNEEYTEDFDAVFVFVGNEPQSQIVPFAELDKSGFIVTDNRMRTSVEGLYAVGDVRNTPFRQIVTAASDGAVAAHDASEYIDELKGNAY
ncbi:MAG: thioredoxin-disulfide reductase [Sphaerochaetaceae bacterium]|nr:thioredoxin-disulfide reductase [Sphaerochaetaceae bacterium]